MDNKAWVWTDELIECFALAYSVDDNYKHLRVETARYKFIESNKEQPVKTWWQKLGIKLDGKWYTHVATNTYDNLDQVMMELSDMVRYYPQESKNLNADGKMNGNATSEFDKEAIDKQKIVLFTTEDGVDIVVGKDEYWFCDERYKVYRTLAVSEQDYKKGIVQYSTEEKLNEYVLMNKPSLSINDAADAYNIFMLERNESFRNQLVRYLLRDKKIKQ